MKNKRTKDSNKSSSSSPASSSKKRKVESKRKTKEDKTTTVRETFLYLDGTHRKGTKKAVDILNEESGDCLRAIVLNVDDCYSMAVLNRSFERIYLSRSECDEKGMDPSEIVHDLERWWRGEYVSKVRRNGELDMKDLEKIMMWKISHSKWRPLLNGIRQKNKSSDVKKHTSKALQEMKSDGREHLKAAIDALTKLKYVGPVTATAILAPLFPSRVAYACDEALEALGFRRDVRSTKDLMKFQDKAREVARSYGVSLLDLTDALWTAAWSDDEAIDNIKDWLVGAGDFAGGHRYEFSVFNASCKSRPGSLL